MLKNDEWEQINEMVASLYGMRNLEAMRKAFLTRLMSLVEFDLADFNLSGEGEQKDGWLKDPVAVSIFDPGVETSFMKLYETKFYRMDYISWIFAHHKSIVYRESDIIDRAVRRESRFYKEYLAQYDLGSVAGISIISAGRLAGAVTLYKSESRGDFSDRDLYILKMFLPHLQNVLESRQGEAEREQEEVRRILKYRYGITEKEQEVMALILAGCSNREIASKKQISENTVKNHISGIFGKIGVKSRTQLLSFLIRNHLLVS